MPDAGGPEDAFQALLVGSNFKEVIGAFNRLCTALQVDRTDHSHVYQAISSKIQAPTAKSLFKLLDARAKKKEYQKGKACAGKNVLIIGAGPCGLRLAIEAALLGARVVVVEMRDYITRNNVLKLWPFVIHDLKSLGAKIFYPKFCTGSLDHISIRCLQTILLKIALLFGVEVFTPVIFKGIVEPHQTPEGTVYGWRADCDPPDHPLHRYEFDVVVGADGKRNSLKGFTRKCMRGKLAIGITANFVNKKTREDNKAKEIGGLLYVYDQEFFDNLKNQCGIELENLVYYKNETHYFVVTAKKHSLIQRGVLKQDFADTKDLLSRENVVKDNLFTYITDAADFSTERLLPSLQFQLDHHGQPDCSIFDFTAMNKADYSCRAIERRGRKLLMCIIGDTLIEPFWPTGSGCGRGFMSAFDATWTIRAWCLEQKPPLEIIAEQESVYKLLSQTAAKDKQNMAKFGIDPVTRYGTRLNLSKVKPSDVEHLFDCASTPEITIDAANDGIEQTPKRRERRKRPVRASVDTTQLLCWYQDTLRSFNDVIDIRNLASSWHDGMAFCCLVAVCKPGSINPRGLDRTQVVANCQAAFDMLAMETGLSPPLSASDFASFSGPDPLALLSYLSQLQARLAQSIPKPEENIITDGRSSPRPKRTRRPSATALLTQVSHLRGYTHRPGTPALASVPEKVNSPSHLSPDSALSPEQQIDRMVAELDAERQEEPPAGNGAASNTDRQNGHREQPGQNSHTDIYTRLHDDEKKKEPEKETVVNAESSGKMYDLPEYKPLKRVPSMPAKPGDNSRRRRPGASLPDAPPVMPKPERLKKPQQRPVSCLISSFNMTDNATNNVQMSTNNAHNQTAKTPPRTTDRSTPEQTEHDSPDLRRRRFDKSDSGSSPGLERHRDNLSGSNSPDLNGSKSPESVVRRRIDEDSIRRPPTAENGNSSKRRTVLELMQQYDNKPIKEDKKEAEVNGGHAPASDVCCVCNRRLGVSERNTAHGYFFHRHCFHCCTCLTSLLLGTSVPEVVSDTKVRFYCYRHAYTLGLVKSSWEVPVVSVNGDAEQDKDDVIDEPTTHETSMASDDLDDLELDEELIDNGSDSDIDDLVDANAEDDEDAYGDEMDAAEIEPPCDSDGEILEIPRERRRRRNAQTEHTLGIHAESIRRMMAFETLRALEELQVQQQELEEEGMTLEQRLRALPDDGEERTELTEEWLDLIQRRNDLTETESQLTIQVKMLELEERQTNIQTKLDHTARDSNDNGDYVDGNVKNVNPLASEIDVLRKQMDHLSAYLS